MPTLRNPRDEKPRIKEGNAPQDRSKENRRQKDIDTRWMRKRGKSFFGYKRQIGVDAEHKLIRHYVTTTANVHGSQVFDALT